MIGKTAELPTGRTEVFTAVITLEFACLLCGRPIVSAGQRCVVCGSPVCTDAQLQRRPEPLDAEVRPRRERPTRRLAEEREEQEAETCAPDAISSVSGAAYDPREMELAHEIRQLARDMVRLEVWACEAAGRSQFNQVSELHWQRELCMERRSRLMRDLWASRYR
jgi:hypothetical protein